MAARRFEDFDAVQRAAAIPKGLRIALTGPQFSGKSYSAGRLATGIQRVVGGQIYWADTEDDRALELAPYFKFRHVPFPQPKEPKEYEDVVRFLLAKPDCGVIVLDQCTHEHVAMLDMIDAYLEKKAGDNWEKRATYQAAAMIRPKAQRKRFEELVCYGLHRANDGMKVPIIMLYRAVDKSVPGKSKRDGGDGQWIHKGWQAETTSTLPYFMTARFLLPPGSDGKPNLTPDTEWEKLAIRNPQQFRDWFQPGFQLTEEVGEKLARWAIGKTDGKVSESERRAEPAQAPPQTDTLEETAPILKEITAVIGRHFPMPPEGMTDACRTARGEARRAAFGTGNWDALKKLPAEQLRVGLDTLKRNLDGLASMRERQPGEDPEEG